MRRSSADTKTTILAVARRHFASLGYDRATIRAIAADARIDPAMVIRYFGDKTHLFTAAAEFDLRLPDLTSVPRERVGLTIIAHFLELWEADNGLKVLLRTAVTSEEAAERMRTIFAGQLVEVMTKLCADPAEAACRAGLASSQVLGMALCRDILRLPPLAAMAHDEIIAWIAPTLQRYLVGPISA